MLIESSNAEAKPISCSKLKLDSLFLQWFSLPESQRLVLKLVEDVKAGRPITTQAARKSNAAPGYHGTTVPPLSPRKAGPLASPSKPASPSTHLKGAHMQHLQQQEGSGIPPFYFPTNGRAHESERREVEIKLESYLAPYSDHLPLQALRLLLKQVFDLPMSFAYPLLQKLAPASGTLMPLSVFLAWMHQCDFLSKSDVCRAFDILRQDSSSFITPNDLRHLMSGILASHPGLAFLADSPEFQDRYAETVVYRILYSLNRSGGNRLSLRDLRRSTLMSALHELDEEEDINKVTQFFSYEHFYVIYCKFWDLDADHDFLLSRDDLLRYGSHALTYRIVDRIFCQCGRPFASGIPGRMGYEDFVWFILSEEDKTTDASLEYWFRCCDLDSDGRITADELLFFYEEQLHRMETLSQESVAFDDVLSQMRDMLGPEDASCFTLIDLKRSRAMAGTLFNVIFNLNKFVAFETRDPFTVRQEREEAASGASEWDRFARNEYVRLAVEEDGGDDDVSDMPWAIDCA